MMDKLAGAIGRFWAEIKRSYYVQDDLDREHIALMWLEEQRHKEALADIESRHQTAMTALLSPPLPEIYVTGSGWVYIIRAKGAGRYKIGHTKSGLEQRLKGLQTASPFQLELVAHVRSVNPEAVESALHKELDSFRVSGEWFELSEDDLIEALRTLYVYGDKE